MKILLAAFEGNYNSAKVILDNMAESPNTDKLYLHNNRDLCVRQLTTKLKNNNYKYIIAIGQKPVIKDKIYIETMGRNSGKLITTTFDYIMLKDYLIQSGYPTKISNNAGTSFCNHFYYHALEYIADNNLDTKIIFLHVPFLKNMKNVKYMSEVFGGYLSAVLP